MHFCTIRERRGGWKLIDHEDWKEEKEGEGGYEGEDDYREDGLYEYGGDGDVMFSMELIAFCLSSHSPRGCG